MSSSTAGNRMNNNVLILLFIFNIVSGEDRTPSCRPSSCGNIARISFPFRLNTDPISCGYNATNFQLDCRNNQTFLKIPMLNSTMDFLVHSINYKEHLIRLAHSGTNSRDLSSCPPPNDPWQDITDFYGYNSFDDLGREVNSKVAFIHCLLPVNSERYVRAPFCGNGHGNRFGNSSKFYSYVMVGFLQISDLEDSCTVDTYRLISARSPKINKSSLIDIYEGFAYGFELRWFIYGKCWRYSHFTLAPNDFVTDLCCSGDPYDCEYTLGIPMKIALNIAWAIGVVLSIRVAIGFVIGFPLLLWLVVHKWRRRHLCIDKNIEKFLQDQRNFAPIKYSYSDVKKMTNNFNQKLGEGSYGIVYKGKLQSGLFVAVKMVNEFISGDEEFINEVGTIGRIHHVNVVQLVGFCVERSKYALVYEFLPNGSLDRYIFNEQSLGVLALTFKNVFEIALGVARGIDYLHHGCDMQILHFDIKPHNILLDENFNPKISDFGLARLCPANESFINLTDARGTMGYMAPEMFYRNMGGISYKADIYSFGMMLIEMVSRRKIMNLNVEGTTQLHFPLWIYDQLRDGKEIEMTNTTEEERKMMKKIMIIASWCIQMKPSDRLPMNKVVRMFESEFEPRMPPKPFLASHEIGANDHGAETYIVDYVKLHV
ncbi:rust resistance kinase Lr10-like [Andrographis paniculata]|uniref:rust resistance kinase Lr10-like n=1 Tax=Andrographis paniculata TaxID=175694 RepID=UPI0021E73700|nr:rust resistance kinase Lr10-like [Andrographis paniculata]